MESRKNVIQILNGAAIINNKFQSIKFQRNSSRISSLVQLRGRSQHLCVLDDAGEHLALLEYQDEQANTQVLQELVNIPDKLHQTPIHQGTSQGHHHPCKKKKVNTGIFTVNLDSGRCSNLGLLQGRCNAAHFCPSAPLLAVLQPPYRIHVFHTELGTCCEVIEFSNILHGLVGMQWLPSSPDRPVSCEGSDAVSASRGDVKKASLSPVLGFTENEIVVFQSAAPSQRLVVDHLAWAVPASDCVVVVLMDAGVQFWSLAAGGSQSSARGGAAAASRLASTTGSAAATTAGSAAAGSSTSPQALSAVIPPPTGAASFLPVVGVTLMPCGRVVVVALRHMRVVVCSLAHASSSVVALEAPRDAPDVSGAAVCAVTAVGVRHETCSELLLVLDTAGRVLVYDAQSWTCIKTLRSPSLRIESFSTSKNGELLSLSYNNHTTKLYRICNLLQKLPLKSADIRSGEAARVCAVHFDEDSKVVTASRPPDPHRRKSCLKKIERATSHPAWRRMLAEFGSFPHEERAAIWCGLLALPRCSAIHTNLCGKAMHPQVPEYEAMADKRLRDSFRRSLSCLYYWAPQLVSYSWVPSFVFPFVKSLQHAPLICFELCVALIMSWCRLWFSPAPDKVACVALNVVEALVCNASPRLMAAFLHARVTAATYAWPLLSSAFSQVLSAEDWLVAWDHLLCESPSYLLCFTAAFSLCLAPSITAAASHPHQIETLYNQESYVPLRCVLKKATELHRSMQLDEELLLKLDHISEYPRDGLPIFDSIPDMQLTNAVGEGGFLQSLGWSLDEEEFERQRAALQEQEADCIARMRRVRQRDKQALCSY
ncbi:TBC1 domain family member 31 [Hyalella azteca]|uniref:TBC1 domain family member 31 n=1 Tax=Hyalella azteca TaxID=294128 RepID=A0A8B7PM03_HYAAZ|nr:TBC1 domain family member 31 [Hyalella azteca]